MSVSDVEDVLFSKMNEARDLAKSHLNALDAQPPDSLNDISAIGLDTNILKALRREAIFADRLSLRLKAQGVSLVVPGQSILEFWNNHKIFASDDWSSFKSDLTRLTKRIENSNATGEHAETVSGIGRLVDGLSSDLQAERAPEYLGVSQNLIRSLLEFASQPMVSRLKFADLARIRFSSKIPPGFEDDKNKTAPYGDFFVWCDFLLGAMCIAPSEVRHKYLWVTDELKPDWKTGTGGHPALIEEFNWIHGGELSIVTYRELKSLIEEADSEVEAARKEFEETVDDG